MRYSFRQALTLLLAGLLLIPTAALAADKKKDPDEIGNRDVGKGLNLYSFEKGLLGGICGSVAA